MVVLMKPDSKVRPHSFFAFVSRASFKGLQRVIAFDGVLTPHTLILT